MKDADAIDFPFSGAWMRLDVDVEAIAGRWARIDYAGDIAAPLQRPAIAWAGADGRCEIALGSAPIFGRGVWIGRIPDFAARGWICAERGGRSRLREVRLRRFGATERFARMLALRPGLAALALRARLNGDVTAADRRQRAALTIRDLNDAADWAAAGGRGDPPPFSLAATAPHLRIISTAPETGARVALAGPPGMWSLRRAAPEAPLAPLIADLSAVDLFCVVADGDVLAPLAGLCVAAAGARSAADLYYADEAAPAGGMLRLKPDWSPILNQSVDLLGRAWFARVGWARARFGDRACGDLTPLRPTADDRVQHVRRVLLETPAPPVVCAPPPAPPAPAAPSGRPRASLIIPTRDRADLLAACLASLPADGDLEIIVADNSDDGGAAREAHAKAARKDPRLRVVPTPGPFNFSKMCNLGASLARAPLLVFLNDDVEARTPDWLDLMAGWAMRPDIGAVGAKLLYPDGRLQHGGVVLGMGGRAGHAERFAAADAPGYFGRLNVPHEISAVTGACLVVAAEKFAAVGGFDEDNLPVDLNDVDLCLRLAQRGWGCVMEPRARLIHHESATRGDHTRGHTRYAAEIAYFTRRWAREIGDDPYFHPALSLDQTDPALA